MQKLWIPIMVLAARTRRMQHLGEKGRAYIEHTARRRWAARILQGFYRNYVVRFVEQRTKGEMTLKTAALGMGRHRRKIKTKREAMLKLLQFLQDLKRMNGLLLAVKRLNLRGRVMAIQQWWRWQLKVFRGQIKVLHLQWDQREAIRIKTICRRIATLEKRRSEERRYTRTSKPRSPAKRKALSADILSLAMDPHINKIPRDVVTRKLQKLQIARRAQHRRKIRAYHRNLEEFMERNRKSIEMNKARVALRQQGKKLLNMPKPPKFHNLLPNAEMDRLIEETSHEVMEEYDRERGTRLTSPDFDAPPSPPRSAKLELPVSPISHEPASPPRLPSDSEPVSGLLLPPSISLYNDHTLMTDPG